MLHELKISNFLLIEDLSFNLQKGLITITGETGAGKSILLGALKLVLGERADLKQIKSQDKKCVIEAVFKPFKNKKLDELLTSSDLDIEDDLILRREITSSGKNRIFVNDTPTTLEVVKKIGKFLIDIHSQFNTSELLEEDYPIRIIDIIADNKEDLKNYKNLYIEWKEISKKLSELNYKLAESKNNSDYNQFIFNELSELKLNNENEQEELEKELSLLENSENILEALQKSNNIIDNDDFGLLQRTNELESTLNSVSKHSKKIEELYKRISSTRIEIQDIKGELDDIYSTLEVNPNKTELVRERLSEFYRLQKKHNVPTLKDLISVRNQYENNVEDVGLVENEIKRLEEKNKNTIVKMDSICIQLHEKRVRTAPKVEKIIVKSIQLLGMDKAKIKFDFSDQKDFSDTGKDKIQIKISANAGMRFSYLNNGISGGERSRLMFAIKNIVARHKSLPTLVFDEIDTGISGRIANEMGNMMVEMSKNTQLIIITHLAQIAAKGNLHFKVHKSYANGKTITHLKRLSLEERKVEIASMISGEEISENAISQAESLLNQKE